MYLDTYVYYCCFFMFLNPNPKIKSQAEYKIVLFL